LLLSSSAGMMTQGLSFTLNSRLSLLLTVNRKTCSRPPCPAADQWLWRGQKIAIFSDCEVAMLSWEWTCGNIGTSLVEGKVMFLSSEMTTTQSFSISLLFNIAMQLNQFTMTKCESLNCHCLDDHFIVFPSGGEFKKLRMLGRVVQTVASRLQCCKKQKGLCFRADSRQDSRRFETLARQARQGSSHCAQRRRGMSESCAIYARSSKENSRSAFRQQRRDSTRPAPRAAVAEKAW